jgi:calcineurin-like phosphoesterase family protein
MDYVTADLHFRHQRIIEFERHRFKNIEEHDKAIIRALNSTLRTGDTLYILGDLGFRENGSLEPVRDCVRRIECAKKILVMGNHDHFSIEEAKSMGFSEVYKHPIYYESKDAQGMILLSHRPLREAYENPYVINVHGHVHNGIVDLPNFYNVNIHMTGYIIQPMKMFENIAVRTCKSRQERFPNEWYAAFETKGEKKFGEGLQ